MPEGQTGKVRIHLTSTLPEDYDVEVYHRQGDGSLKQVGLPGNIPGADEEVVLDAPAAGTYVIRVVYYAALTGSYEVKVSRVTVETQTTTGAKEAYRLTCERPDGTVLQRHSLVIDRGQRVTLALGCGRGPSRFANGTAITGDADATPSIAPSVDGVPVPAAKRKPTRAQRLATCRKKAKRIKSASKRRAALRSCQRRYGRKSS